MKFSSKRGRPALQKSQKDLGTKELRAKKALNALAQPIDILLRKSLISDDQHKAAMRLRWLYHLRFGNLNLRAYDPGYLGGKSIIYDQEFLAKKSILYQKIIDYFSKNKILNILLNLVVFDIFPTCLLKQVRNISSLNKSNIENELDNIKMGLDFILGLQASSRASA